MTTKVRNSSTITFNLFGPAPFGQFLTGSQTRVVSHQVSLNSLTFIRLMDDYLIRTSYLPYSLRLISMTARPFNFPQCIAEHRHPPKPPVGNQQVLQDNQDSIVLVANGRPNACGNDRVDASKELFIRQGETMTGKVMAGGKPADGQPEAGEMFLLPPTAPHSLRRAVGTVGLMLKR